MPTYGEEEREQGEMLLDAIERSGRPRKAVAAELGVAYQTLDGWIRGERRIPLTLLGLMCKVLGPWYLNRLLEPHGYRVVRVSPLKEIDLFEEVKDAALRIGGSAGRLAGEIADATANDGPGGSAITTEEAEELRSTITEAEAYLEHLKEKLTAVTAAN